ncbi:hypothetical protein OESDEN_20929 [Oesophagostomum dentatum]|uniref:Uncharacterized protein n=1 Tax=Oesophagostomum dentatum TaxID=61180 RepID=A0A0B1S862_OESDE|nr:hypothetical protein OESDEN_20929 [Oesophagostomum dentatum]
MVYEVVHREPLYRIYCASKTSVAYLIKTIFDAIRILLPVVVIFSTHVSEFHTRVHRSSILCIHFSIP